MARNKYELAESLSSPQQNQMEILSPEELNQMTLTEFKQKKDVLAMRRQQIMLRLDGRKLEQATKIMDSMESIIDRIGVTAVKGTALDLKLLVESYDKLSKTLNTICRLDTVDGSGKAARLALQVDFGNGTSVKTMIET